MRGLVQKQQPYNQHIYADTGGLLAFWFITTMNSSSNSNILHLNWARCAIPILWVAGIVFLLACFYETLRARCQAIYEEHIQPLRRSRHQTQPPGNDVVDNPLMESISRGLASSVVQSLPAMQFHGGVKNSSLGSSECAVCLGEFIEDEWLRLLPNCTHVFHVSCIDTWLCSHSSCPLCRTNVLDGSSVGEFQISPVSLLQSLQREDMQHESLASHGEERTTP